MPRSKSPRYRGATPKLTAGEHKIHCHLCFHLDGFPVQKVGAISPLTYGLNRSWRKHGMAAEQLQILDGSVLSDGRSQPNATLNPSRFNAVHQIAFHHVRNRRVMGRHGRRGDDDWEPIPGGAENTVVRTGPSP